MNIMGHGWDAHTEEGLLGGQLQMNRRALAGDSAVQRTEGFNEGIQLGSTGKGEAVENNDFTGLRRSWQTVGSDDRKYLEWSTPALNTCQASLVTGDCSVTQLRGD